MHLSSIQLKAAYIVFSSYSSYVIFYIIFAKDEWSNISKLASWLDMDFKLCFQFLPSSLREGKVIFLVYVHRDFLDSQGPN